MSWLDFFLNFSSARARALPSSTRSLKVRFEGRLADCALVNKASLLFGIDILVLISFALSGSLEVATMD